MKISTFLPRIPYGMKDFLPGEASRKRSVETALGSLFARWGYDEVITPTFEYLDTLTIGANCDSGNNMYKFFDKNNVVLALRPDMTTPIARVAATRMRECELPVKLFYLTNVFRHEEAQAGRQCEFYQAGVELLGISGPAADAEVIALAVEAMLEAGLVNFQISMGQVDFINGIMDEYELSIEQRQQIKKSMLDRDLVGLGEMLNVSGLNAEAQQVLKRIPLLHGREDMLKQAYNMVDNSVSLSSLDNLSEIYELLKNYGIEKYATFDLGIIRNFDYYTGMVFEGYTPGLGFPVCGGGRYDNMVSAFGMDCPATGFAMGIERILLALERQGIASVAGPKDIYIGWQQGKINEAIRIASEKRKSGKTVEVGLFAQSEADARECQQKKRFDELIYLEDK